MNGLILGHAGGLDEMAMLLFPVVVGLGAWLFTRQANRPPTKRQTHFPDAGRSNATTMRWPHQTSKPGGWNTSTRRPANNVDRPPGDGGADRGVDGDALDRR